MKDAPQSKANSQQPNSIPSSGAFFMVVGKPPVGEIDSLSFDSVSILIEMKTSTLSVSCSIAAPLSDQNSKISL